MPEITFTCECGKVYQFDARFAGRSGRCMDCKRDYVVPTVREPVAAEPVAAAVDELSDHSTILLAIPPVLDNWKAAPEEHSGKKSSVMPPIPVPVPVSVSVFSKKTPEPEKTLKRLGKFEIREKIGSGGMGSVFHAWDTVLHRNVTVKTLNERSRKQSSFRERFINEARITGKLVHSGVVPVYSLEFDKKDTPYYVMRLLEGRTLEQSITQYHNLNGPSHTPEELRRLIRQFIDVCQTIAYAHDNFVVHRDIKPANIMLGGYGETIVLDWGLAKMLSNGKDENMEDTEDTGDTEEIDGNLETEDGAVNLTITGNRVGTPGYQSPEYLHKGVSQPSDDIYALGVTLYFLLCNKLPHKLSRENQGLFDILMTPPNPPHLINSHISRQLSAVCLCAMAYDTSKRYPSASLFAADLQRWLDGKAVTVYRMKWGEKLRFWLRKNALAITVAVTAFSLGVITRLFF